MLDSNINVNYIKVTGLSRSFLYCWIISRPVVFNELSQHHAGHSFDCGLCYYKRHRFEFEARTINVDMTLYNSNVFKYNYVNEDENKLGKSL